MFLASSFGLSCLRVCTEIPEIEVVGIVTAPKIFRISYRPQGVINVLHVDAFEIGRTLGVKVVAIERSMNDQGLYEMVSTWEPDAFIAAGWYHMIPRRWRLLAPAYGLHASLLPDYSGGAPLVWAIINGESKTGISLFQMDDGVDSGPIAGQKEEYILHDDTISTLYARIEERGRELLKETLPQIAAGTLKLRLQDESKRRVYPQRSPEDGWIDWSQDASMVDRFIRAQTRPYPGAFSTLHGKTLHIWSAAVVGSEGMAESGKVQRKKDGTYIVSCASGSIQLKDISYESENYSLHDLERLFGVGGQILGGS